MSVHSNIPFTALLFSLFPRAPQKKREQDVAERNIQLKVSSSGCRLTNQTRL